MTYDLATIESDEKKRELEILGERKDWIKAFYNPKNGTIIMHPEAWESVLESENIRMAGVRDGHGRSVLSEVKVAFTSKV